MKHTNKKGFTIVELVIVIAVIAILAAVLIPNLSRLVTKANESAAMQEAKAAMDNDLINADGDLANMTTYQTSDGKQYYAVKEAASTYTAAAEGNVVLAVTATATTVATAAVEGATYYEAHIYEGKYDKTNEAYTFENDKYTCTFANGEWKVDPKTNS